MEGRKGIWIADHSGDQLLCVDGTTKGKTARCRQIAGSDESVQVSWEALDAFMTDCINRHGYSPLVAGREVGQTDFRMLHPAGRRKFELQPSDLKQIEEILVARPLVGG